MLTIQQRDAFRSMLYKFMRENNISRNDIDFANMIKGWYSVFAESAKQYEPTNVEITKGKDKDDFFELHKKIVNMCIDYIITHPNVNEAINTKITELTNLWNEPNAETKILPDVRISFGADGIDNSLEHKEWTPATDSALAINVANESIIWSM